MARSKKVAGDICRHMKNRVPKKGHCFNILFYYRINVSDTLHILDLRVN